MLLHGQRIGRGCTERRSCRTNAVPTPSSSSPSSSGHQQDHVLSRRLLGLGIAISMGIATRSPAQAAEASLVQSTLQALQAEAAFIQAQEQAEERALQAEIDRTKEGKFCATPFGVDLVGITQLVALVGAVVGGVAARQRKEEVERLNEQLRKINLQLKKKLKAAPGAHHGNNGSAAAHATSLAEAARRQASATSDASSSGAGAGDGASDANTTKLQSTYLSMEEEEFITPDAMACRDALRQGKQLLRDKNGSAAMVRFEKALMMSKAMGDKVQERRATRGLAAAARLQKQYRTAIQHFERVLAIQREMGDFAGYADVLGATADCYADLGEMDKAAHFYDEYIKNMERDSFVTA